MLPLAIGPLQEGNTPGACRLQFVLADDILTFPQEVRGTVPTEIVLKEGKAWTTVTPTQWTQDFREEAVEVDGDQFSRASLGFRLPKDRPALLHGLWSLKPGRYVVLHHDLNRTVKVMGTKDEPAVVRLENLQHGADPRTQGNRYALTVEVSRRTECPFYLAEPPQPQEPGGTCPTLQQQLATAPWSTIQGYLSEGQLVEAVAALCDNCPTLAAMISASTWSTIEALLSSGQLSEAQASICQSLCDLMDAAFGPGTPSDNIIVAGAGDADGEYEPFEIDGNGNQVYQLGPYLVAYSTTLDRWYIEGGSVFEQSDEDGESPTDVSWPGGITVVSAGSGLDASAIVACWNTEQRAAVAAELGLVPAEDCDPLEVQLETGGDAPAVIATVAEPCGGTALLSASTAIPNTIRVTIAGDPGTTGLYYLAGVDGYYGQPYWLNAAGDRGLVANDQSGSNYQWSVGGWDGGLDEAYHFTTGYHASPVGVSEWTTSIPTNPGRMVSVLAANLGNAFCPAPATLFDVQLALTEPGSVVDDVFNKLSTASKAALLASECPACPEPPPANVLREYTTNGTWPEPTHPDYKGAWVLLAGGAGSGAAGSVGATNRTGGTGGGGGALVRRWIPAAARGSISVTIGTGGASVSSGAGNNGGDTSLGSIAIAKGGNGGIFNGGTIQPGALGGDVLACTPVASGMADGGAPAGQAGRTTANTLAGGDGMTVFAGAGGGAGGGYTTGGGAAGSRGGGIWHNGTLTQGGDGASAGNDGTNGVDDINTNPFGDLVASTIGFGTAGGGGGGSGAAGSTGGNGGNGGRAAGGGGGGAGTVTGGSGGAGGNGFCIIYEVYGA